MGSGRDDVLVLRAPAADRLRGSAAAGLALAVSGAVGGVYLVIVGHVLFGLAIAGCSAYVGPGWWRAVRRPGLGREILRMDPEGVTVHHDRAGDEPIAWSTDWRQVRGLRVREIGVPQQLQTHLGPVTKVLTIDVLDHRAVEGPKEHRERLFPWALLAATTSSRMRLQVFLAEVSPDGARTLMAWMAQHRPEVALDIDVTAPDAPARERLPSRVAVVAEEPALRAALVQRLRQGGLRPEEMEADDPESLTEQLRACTVIVAADADPSVLCEVTARAGVDRVLLVSSSGEDATVLLDSDRAWTVVEVKVEGADPGREPQLTPQRIAESAVTLLQSRETVRRVWRLGPDGVPVAAARQA